MTYEQVLSPNTAVTSRAGMCLWFTEEAYGFKPHTGIASATDAFHASAKKHYDAHPTNVSVPIYLTHYGSYDTPAVYKDWGHYFLYVPGRGYLSSPITFLGPGQQWFKSIDEIVATILRTAPNSKTKYVGWTEDIAGRLIVKEETMAETIEVLESALNAARAEAEAAKNADMVHESALNAALGQVSELSKVIAIKDKEINRLAAQLAVQSEDTQLLNGFGEWLTKLIARLGLKK